MLNPSVLTLFLLLVSGEVFLLLKGQGWILLSDTFQNLPELDKVGFHDGKAPSKPLSLPRGICLPFALQGSKP